MEHLLLIIIGILLLIIFVLVAKVYFLRKSAQEIAEAFRDRLTVDTNTLIDISTRDPYMRKLAADINVQLRLLRKERHRYQQGDLELKEAVTNISHDLRTPLTAINGYPDSKSDLFAVFIERCWEMTGKNRYPDSKSFCLSTHLGQRKPPVPQTDSLGHRDRRFGFSDCSRTDGFVSFFIQGCH